jgi:flagellar biosynthesis protein FlhG
MPANSQISTMDYIKRIWPIGGGKGGVGKSLITANLGIALANYLKEQNKDVLLLDADLGSGTLHNYLGIRNRKFTLDDFFRKHKKKLNEIIIDSPLENLKLISGGVEILNLANPKYQQKARLLQSIKQMNAEYILLDLAPTSHYNTVDFFSLSNEGIIVTTPEPASIQSSYGFLKNALYRKLNRFWKNNTLAMQIFKETVSGNGQYSVKNVRELIEKIKNINADLAYKCLEILNDFRPQLILNMVESRKDLSVIDRYQNIVRKYLNINIKYLGYILFDKNVRKAARSMNPILLEYPQTKAASCIFNIAEKLINISFQSMS